MPTAPRFNPSGVAVGSMPTPQVRANTGPAEAMAAVGETIASLGKSYQQSQAIQEARVRESETAGREAALEDNSQYEALYSEQKKTGTGASTMDAKNSFDKSLEQFKSEKRDSLNPVARLEYDRIDRMNRRSVSSASGEFAASHQKAYSASVNTAAFTVMSQKAVHEIASAGPQAEEYTLAALTAAEAVAVARGQVWDKNTEDMLVGGLHFEALTNLVKDDPHAAVAYHKRTKKLAQGGYGSMAAAADKAVAGAQDVVFVDKAYAAVVSRMTDIYGVFHPEMADSATLAFGNEQPKRMQLLQQKLDAQAAADLSRRNKLGESAYAQYQDAQQTSYAAGVSAMAQITSPDIWNQLTVEQQSKIREREGRGPEYSDPDEFDRLKAQIINEPAKAATQQYDQAMLTIADQRTLFELRGKSAGIESENTAKWAREVYNQGPRTMPRAAEGEELKGEDLDIYNNMAGLTASATADIKADKLGKLYPGGMTESNFKKALSINMTKTEVSAGGWAGGGVKNIYANDYPLPENLTDTELATLGLKRTDPPIVVATQVNKARAEAKAIADAAKDAADAAAAVVRGAWNQRPEANPFTAYWQKEVDMFRARNNLR